MQAEHQRVQNELFELQNSREAQAHAEADDADLSAQEHDEAVRQIG